MGDSSLKYDSYSNVAHERNNGGSDGGKVGIKNNGDSGDGSVLASALEKRVATMQKELNYSLRRIGEKESEKFDLIFAILSELQSRQAKLEDTVRTLRAQQCGSAGGFGGEDQGHNNGRCMTNGQNGGCNGGCNGMGGQPMQAVQFGCMPQVVIMSPTGPMTGNAMQGMQYAMMQPAGAMQMQQMPGQMMNFMGPQAQMPSSNGGACSSGNCEGDMNTNGSTEPAAACAPSEATTCES